MATRKHTPPPASKAPTNHIAWNNLLTKAIQRAASNKDPRVAGLRRAMTEGKSEKILRQMGILSEVDIDREFPVNAT